MVSLKQVTAEDDRPQIRKKTACAQPFSASALLFAACKLPKMCMISTFSPKSSITKYLITIKLKNRRSSTYQTCIWMLERGIISCMISKRQIDGRSASNSQSIRLINIRSTKY